MSGNQERINVLLIEDTPGDAVQIREMLLGGAGASFAVQWAQNLEQGLERARAEKADIALLDLNLPESSGLESFDRLHAAAPGLPIVVLSGSDDESFALAAVRRGAEDSLVKSKLEAETLKRCLRRTVERCSRRGVTVQQLASKKKPRGRVLGFVGAKGGVGTTTVALNVAAALAAGGDTVSALELRGYPGTFSHHFPHPPHYNLSSLLRLEETAINELELNAKSTKQSSGLRVLFGPQRVEESSPVPGGHARAVVDCLSRMSRYLVLDLPPEPSPANEEALRLCDFVGVVLDREASCLQAAQLAMDQIRRWGVDGLLGAVLVHRSPLARPLEIEEITRKLGVGVAGLIPPAPDSCILAQTAGVPVVIHQGETLVGDSLKQLAAQLAEDPIEFRASA